MARWLLLARERWPVTPQPAIGLSIEEWQAHHAADVEAVDQSFDGYLAETFAAVVHAATAGGAIALLDDYAWRPWVRPDVRELPARHPDEPAQWRALANEDAALMMEANRQPSATHMRALGEARWSLLERAEALGGQHPLTAHVLSILRGHCQDFGPTDQIAPLARRILTVHESFVGPDDPSLVVDWIRLAQAERGLEPHGPEHAPFVSQTPHELAYERAIELAERGLPPGHPMRVAALHQFALYLSGDQQHDRALPLWRRALEEAEVNKRHPDGDPAWSLSPTRVASILPHLGSALRAAGQADAAESVFRRLLRLLEVERGAEHWQVMHARADLADACAAAGKLEEAAELWTRVLRTHDAREEQAQQLRTPPEQPHEARAAGGGLRAHYLDRYAALLQRLGRAAEARAARDEASQLRAATAALRSPRS